ncbi:MAG: DNA-binding transcriptional regulator Fis [Gammaproteobacteria bacterium]|nr:DNA-binding transcriptional regulator Fis [Gammaproteobacteria bacterium]CAJ2376321.1 MAG: Putative Fis-like DNA-binding protein [Arenicellales bacterium IbO2]MDA7961705.1 DNA-binding transcriptional regulator Fis [Gammaproteobacteria bacterium]MDA7967464.1 DNA-binding transcriptional regulator Fis [Gammaproteobacteria bacterium]MDA7969245.1 DNA-binding transcriptional regulator Fis [Gammaproteobacteria bacterium]
MTKKTRTISLCDCVEKTVDRYFTDLNGEEASGVYQMVLGEIEKPLLEVVMKRAGENQSKASRMLGINRNTLRKKLEQYGLNGSA